MLRSPKFYATKLFTADSQIILYCTGQIKKTKLDQAIDKIIEIIKE